MKEMHTYAIMHVHKEKLQGLAPDGTLFHAGHIGAVQFFRTVPEGLSIIDACAPLGNHNDYQVIQLVLTEY